MKRLFYATLLALSPLPGLAETVTLDLNQAVSRALDVDARIGEKQHLVDAARALLAEARGATRTSYNVNTFVGMAPRVRGGFFETTDTAGNKTIGVPSDAFDINGLTPWYYLDFQIIRPLYTFGKAESYQAAASGNIKVKEGDVARQRSEVTLDVYRAYHGYLTARDTRHLLEDAQGKLSGAQNLVQQWLDDGEGDATQSDLFALQTGVALTKRYIAEATGLERIALAGLKLLTGTTDQDVQVADQHLEALALPTESLEQLQATALTKRPELAQLRAGLEARRALLAAKQADARPNLYTGVVGVISYAPGRSELQDTGPYDPFFSAGLTPVVGLKWEWASGRQPAQVAQAQAELDATLSTQAFADKGIPFQVTEQYHQVQAHHTMVHELYEGSRAGRRWMISTYADFEAGVQTADKVITAMQGYVLAYSEYLKVLNEYNLRIAQLRIATGDIQ